MGNHNVLSYFYCEHICLVNTPFTNPLKDDNEIAETNSSYRRFVSIISLFCDLLKSVVD